MPRIPELAQRDRFVRRAVAEGRVLTLADEESASVPSQKFVGRTVQLFWSSPIEARRWAKALTGNPELQEIELQTFAADILPGLARAKGLAGTDWVTDPIEAEVDPGDLLIRVKTEALTGWLKLLGDDRNVYLVAAADGPVLTTRQGRTGGEAEALPVFASRVAAERNQKSLGGRRITADPVEDFLTSTLPWAEGRGLTLIVEPIPGAGFTELKPQDLVRRLGAA